MRLSVRHGLAVLFLAACGTAGPTLPNGAGSGAAGSASGSGSAGSPSSGGTPASGGAMTGASSGAATSGVASGANSPSGASGSLRSPDAATTGASSGTASSGQSACPSSAFNIFNATCSGSTTCEYGQASCCGFSSSATTCKCQNTRFSCYQTVECNVICPAPADASSDADARALSSDASTGDAGLGTLCSASSECAAGLLCCYPCGIAGCHNRCVTPIQGRCPQVG